MSQLNAATTQVNTVTSSGSTVAIPKNIDVTGNINFTGDLLQNGVLFETLLNNSMVSKAWGEGGGGLAIFFGTSQLLNQGAGWQNKLLLTRGKTDVCLTTPLIKKW